MTEPHQRVTVLLVDDDASMVRLLASVIERYCGDHLEVESLTDAAAARARVEEGGVDILLTDLEMPDVDGLELLRAAKRRNAYTQVVFLTGHSTKQALLEALELGASDYLIKPIDQQELLELVDDAVRRQRRWKFALAETWQQQREEAGARR